MMDVTVLIADSRPLARLGLRTALESVSFIKVVAEAACDTEAVRRAVLVRPDVMLIDIGLPEMGGVRTTRLTMLDSPETRALILGDAGSVAGGPRGFASHSSLYVPNDIAPDALVSLVQHLAKAQVDTDGAEYQAAWGDGGSGCVARHPSGPTDRLTHREWEILGWVSCGLTNREIARLLALSEHTIKNHVRNVLHKLGAKNRTAASAYFRERSPQPLPELSQSLDIAECYGAFNG